MKVSKERLRDIIEEEVLNLSEEDVELEPEEPEELELSGPEKLRAEMPVQELAQVVMKLIGQHPEGVEVLKMAFDELYGLEVAEYEEEEDPYTPVGPEAEPVRGPIGFKESLARIVKEEVSKALKEYTEVDPIGRAQQRLDRVPFTEWIAQVEELGFQFGEDSPNPYDAWLRSSTPQDYVQEGGIELEEEKAKNNPWAICTAEVGREDKEKYERCVKSVKKGD